MSLRDKLIPGVNDALDYLAQFVDVSLPRVRKLKPGPEIRYHPDRKILEYNPEEFSAISPEDNYLYYGETAGFVISEIIHDKNIQTVRARFSETVDALTKRHEVPSFNPATNDEDFYCALTHMFPIVCGIAYANHKLGSDTVEERLKIIKEYSPADPYPMIIDEKFSWGKHPKRFLRIKTREDYSLACHETGIKGVLLNPNCQAQWEQMYCHEIVTTAFDDLSCKFGMLGCSPPNVDITHNPADLQYNVETKRINIPRSLFYPPNTELVRQYNVATLIASHLLRLRNPFVNDRIIERSNLAKRAHLPELTLSLPDEVGFLSQCLTVITLAGAIYHLTGLDKPNIGKFIARIAPISNARSNAVEFVEALSLSAHQTPDCLAELAAVTSEEDYARFCRRRNQKSYLLNSNRPLPELIVIPNGKLLVVEQAGE